MSESIRATRAIVTIGHFTVDGFMLPDGSYRMSLTQAAECVGLTTRNASDFLQSKAFKSLMGEGYTVPISEIESDPDQGRGQTRIRALPLTVVSKYWNWQSHRGSKQAFALVDALITESLERRFDSAFGVTRSEDDFNQRLSDRVIAQLENDLSEAFSVESVISNENKYLMQVLRDNGIDPWALPQDEES